VFVLEALRKISTALHLSGIWVLKNNHAENIKCSAMLRTSVMQQAGQPPQDQGTNWHAARHNNAFTVT